MNTLVNQLIENRQGNYCHVLELNNASELENIIEEVYTQEESEHGAETIKDFFNTITIYFLEDEELTEYENKDNEEELFRFNSDKFINDLI